MVRPVARFRPAARRSGGDLVPVFFIEENAAGLIEIRSGIQPGGIVATLDVYNDEPQTLAPTASRGLLTSLIAQVSDFGDPAQGDETRIYSQSETIAENRRWTVLTWHVINQVAYVAIAREHTVRHSASVSYQYFSFQGEQGLEFGPVGPVLNVTRSGTLDVALDMVAYSIDLSSGEVSIASELVYTHETTSIAWGAFLTLVATAVSTRYPAPLVLSGLLPSSHPFKDCGPSIWSLTSVASGPTIVTGNNLQQWNVLTTKNEISRSFETMLALNTAASRRVIRKALFVSGPAFVIELSTYQNSSASTCDLYKDIGLAWADSFASYAPSALLDRDAVFADLDGFSPEDQELFLATSLEPPAGIAPGASTAGSTSDAIYFMETENRPNLSFISGSSTLRYWIVD